MNFSPVICFHALAISNGSIILDARDSLRNSGFFFETRRVVFETEELPILVMTMARKAQQRRIGGKDAFRARLDCTATTTTTA